jgi:tetratricopeptide (TPR) repeat protein
MTKKRIAITILIIAVVVIVIAAVILKLPKNSKKAAAQQYSLTNSVASVLTKTNQDFASAEQYRGQSDYSDALQYYQSALPQAQDSAQTVQIQYNIALMQIFDGQYSPAITGLKQIAANQTAGARMQAYAVQELGVMYNNYYGSGSDSIPADTFTGTPYANFLQDGDMSLAYRHLFEYATSFMPLGYSETGIALWYANDLIDTQKGATTTPQSISDIASVDQSLNAADISVVETQNDPNLASLVSATIGREGEVAAELVSVGVLDPSRAEHYFQQGINFDTAFGYRPGSFNTYRYAAFLASQYGVSTSSKIVALLSPFKVNNNSAIALNIPDFFLSARTNQVLASDKASLLSLAGIDADFKAYLISIGWQISDFSSQND